MTIEHLANLQNWGPILHIFLVNLVLSGDNALVIALAAHRLPPAQRRQAILWGGLLAVLQRIAFTWLATYLLRLPGLMFLGGLALFYIAHQLMVADEDRAEQAEAGATHDLWSAVRMIFIADLVMSLDNVLAVAGASGGDVGHMLLGLLISVACIMCCSSAIATIMNRYAWLVYAGAGVLAFTAADMVLSSRETAAFCTHAPGICLSDDWEKWMVTQGRVASFQLPASVPASFADRLDHAAGKLEWYGPMSADDHDRLLACVATDRDRQVIASMFAEARLDETALPPGLSQSFVAPLFANKWLPEVWQSVKDRRYPGAASLLQMLAIALCVGSGLYRRRWRAYTQPAGPS